MKKITWPLLLALGMGVFSPTQAKVEHILPFPKDVKNITTDAVFTLTGGEVTVNGIASNPSLERFFKEFGVQTVHFNANGTGGQVVVEMVNNVPHTTDYVLDGYQNEAYKIEVTASSIKITAATAVGVTRAAQTLTQMAEGWGSKSGIKLQGGTITDYPSFKLRGYMHDIGRSYMQVDELKRQIRLFSRFKVNTFHWHLTENQGFRFEVLNNPNNAEVKDTELTKINQSSTMSRDAGKYYKQSEIKEIVALAKEYGVTIIPEIDIPGHSEAFTKAFGFKMQDAQALPILKEILRQVSEVFPADVSPYIDFGADEVATNATFVKSIADYIHTLGRKAEVWNPINNVNLSQTGTDLHHMWGTRGKALVGKPNIDSRYNYTNHFDVFADLVGIYKSNIYFEPYATNTVAGAICATWNDRRVDGDDQIMKLNNIYANTIATACRAWQGGGEQYIDNGNNYSKPSDSHSNGKSGGGVTLPNDGKEYDDFKRWEDAFLFHKDNALKEVAYQIPYVKQTNVRWRITEAFPNGGDRNMKFAPETAFEAQGNNYSTKLPASFEYNGKTYATGMATGAGIYLSHTWGNGVIHGYYSNPQFGHTAYAWTYVYSDRQQEVGANIEFYNYSRSESNGIPSEGNWDHMGSKIWINGHEIAAPKFNYQNGTGNGKEKLLEDANFAARKPIKVTLNQGWNQVFLKLPYLNQNTRLPKWMFTCVFTDMKGEKAVDGLIYSPSQSKSVEAELVAVKVAEIENYRDNQTINAPGYFNAPEAVNTLNAAIKRVTDSFEQTMTAEQRKQQMNELDEALKTFKAALTKAAIIMPQVSTTQTPVYYTLKADLREGRFVTSMGKDAVMKGETAALRSSCWRFEKRADNTFDIINYDGNYISPASNFNTGIKAVAQKPATGWNLMSTGTAGRVIFNNGTVELNQTTSGQHYAIYNWSSNQDGQDKSDAGCQYSINLVKDAANMSMGGYVASVSNMVSGRVYTFQNQRSGKFLTVNASSDAVTVTSDVQPSDESGHWAYYVSKKGYKYLYSVKAKKFMDYNNGIGLLAEPQGHGVEFKAANVKGHADYPVMFTLNNGGGTVHVGTTNSGNLMYWTGGWSKADDGGNAYRLNYFDNASAELLKAVETAVNKHELNVAPAHNDIMPVAGKKYYFYNHHKKGDQYFWANGDAIAFSNTNDMNDAYVWVCEADGDKLAFKNVKTNKYFAAWQGMSAKKFSWTVSSSNAKNQGFVTLKGYREADKKDKYLVCKVNAFNQATAPDYYNDTYSSDFKFVEYVEGMPVPGKNYYFSVKHPGGNRYFVDNGGSAAEFVENKAVDKKYVWTCETGENGKLRFKNVGTGRYFAWKNMQNNAYGWVVDNTLGKLNQDGVINSGNVTMKGNSYLVIKKSGNNYSYNQANHAGYYNNEFSSDFNFEYCTYDFDAAKPADFMSTTYGEKWVRLYWNSNISHAAGFVATTATGYTNRAAKSNLVSLTNEEQIWSLVGDNDNGFILQNKAAGKDLAMKVSGTTQASTTSMVAVKSATKWKLVAKSKGVFAITPASTSNMSLNSYGGALNELKLYDADDQGSKWQLEVVVPAFTLGTHVSGSVDPQYLLGGGTLNFVINGRVVTSSVEGNAVAARCYLPAEAKVKVSQAVSRGYKVDKLLVDGVRKDFAEFTVAENMQNKVEAYFTSSYENGLYLFKTPGPNGKPYRIPAIATALNGDIIAISDYRPGGADVGRGEVDIKYRFSSDNGHTWTAEKTLADGHWNQGEKWQYSFGDAAVVADCERNEILIMMVCGNTNCIVGNYDPNDSSKDPNRVARSYATYDEATKSWNVSEPVEVTNTIYPKFEKDGKATVRSLFIGSGRICQSRVIKVKDYYRLYCAVWTRDNGNRVIYSDDFGKSWEVLGGVDARPAPNGDEPKCEELPDGSVILSSRKNHGRYFNVFTFNEGSTTEGRWSGVVASDTQTGGIKFGGNSTNGEIYSVQALNTNGEKKTVMLQSVPTGGGRSHVGFFFKEIDPNVKYTSTTFAQNWKSGMLVSEQNSAYSTMTLQKDNKIGFFFEEAPGEYCMVYIPLTLEQITKDEYRLDTAVYGNFLTTHEAKNLNCALASYSASVATTPNIAGVKAFYAAEVVGNVVKMTEIAADANGKVTIPANTGVLLQTTTAQKFSMMPTKEEGTAVTGNKLVATANQAVTVGAGVNAYILSDDAEGAAFFKLSAAERTIAANRAYLDLSSNLNAEKMKISFGDLTGLEGVETDEVNAPVYDLSGRRVVKAVKGGIYIQNGRKFIVK